MSVKKGKLCLIVQTLPDIAYFNAKNYYYQLLYDAMAR